MIMRQRAWQGVSWVSGFVVALVVKKLFRAGYRSVRKADPDAAVDLTKAGFSWPDALVWAVAAGVGLVITKMVSARVAAFGWEAATGTRPPAAVEEPAVG
jgi:Protein of unknown function (DUF4235)